MLCQCCFESVCFLQCAVSYKRKSALHTFGSEPVFLHHDQRGGDPRLGRSKGVLRQVQPQGDSGQVYEQALRHRTTEGSNMFCPSETRLRFFFKKNYKVKLSFASLSGLLQALCLPVNIYPALLRS